MTTASRPWRLIDTGPLNGPANMAVDEALLESFDPDESAPVFRIYGWTPPALSLGRYQNAATVLDLEHCAAESVAVVRRITGGGVIYHAGELTYALVCAPKHILPATSIKDSFRVLTSFLLRFYGGLGLNPRYALEDTATAGLHGERTAFCFAGRESYDILIGGKKIGGNAQRRLKNVIFQHGSIPLENCAFLGSGFLREPPVGVAERVVSLGELGINPDLERLKGRLADAFREGLGCSLAPGGLTPEEELRAERLELLKYGNPLWNRGGITEKT